MFADFYREVDQAYPDAIEKLKFNEALRYVLDKLVTDLIEHTQNQISVRAVESLEDVRACPTRLVLLSSAVEQERRDLKQFLHMNLYFSEALDQLNQGRVSKSTRDGHVTRFLYINFRRM